MCISRASTIKIHLLSCLIPVNLVVLLVVLIDYIDDISFSKWRENRGYIYLCARSVICVPLLRAPQYSKFACCLIPVVTLVVLLVMLDDIDDISFSKRRYFLIVSWMSISFYCIPTRDTHITRDMCMGIHISRGYISLWHWKQRYRSFVSEQRTHPWKENSSNKHGGRFWLKTCWSVTQLESFCCTGLFCYRWKKLTFQILHQLGNL